MSDSRFHLKVKFEVYGQTFEWSPSLNWCAEPGACDERISDWFAEAYEKAYGKFQEANIRYEQKRQQEELEERERAELARLQAKYVTHPKD